MGLKQLNDQSTLTIEMPMVQIILDPAAPSELKEYALAKIKGNRILLDRIFQTFDVRNVDEVLGSITALEQTLNEPGPQGTPSNGTAAPGVAPAPANVNVNVPAPVL